MDLAYLEENVPTSFERTFQGIDRVREIVLAMKEFSHPDQREKAALDLNRIIENTLTVARNEYKYVADVETTFGDIPPVRGHAGEIGQVLLNLIVNAAHAIDDAVEGTDRRGTIGIVTARDSDERVCLSISDTGTGIPEDARGRVFDPFFTTKEVGRGTGQGLSIAHSVITEKHGGEIRFETKTGVGTTFHILLPVADDGSGRSSES